MMGKTSIRIDRHPDFFKLLSLRGESKVFIAEVNDLIIGCICVSMQHVYINKEIKPVYYVGDFKVLPEFRGKGVGIELCKELTNFLLDAGADLVFLTVAEGNKKPLPFFKDRPGIPDFENIGTFIIHQLIGNRRNINHGNYNIKKEVASNETVSFLDDYFRKYELGSVITKDKLEGLDIYCVRENNTLKGVMCLTDTMNIKQNVVIKLPWSLKNALKSINSIRRITGISKMPEENDAVKMIYIKWIAIRNNDKGVFSSLINHARKIVYEKSYSFASLGIHEKDSLNNYLPRIFRLSFKASGMFLTMKNNIEILQHVSDGIPFEDYSLV
jgi:GNAT superfamily N-acetyltransferase